MYVTYNMKKIENKMFISLIILATILAGIFCSQGIQMMSAHCSMEGNTGLVCDNVFTHGSIISKAIVNTVVSGIFLLTAVFLIIPFLKLTLKKFRCSYHLLPSTIYYFRRCFLIPNFMLTAFSRGILHSKNP
jgi:hypothetical protein